MRTCLRTNLRTRVRGLSMIEVLVGVLLISFGLLGLISLQGRALQFSVGSEDNQRAALFASEMVSQIWNANGIGGLQADAVPRWQAAVSAPVTGLPLGEGSLRTDTSATATTTRVTIRWRAPNAASGDRRSYFTDVVIPVPTP